MLLLSSKTGTETMKFLHFNYMQFEVSYPESRYNLLHGENRVQKLFSFDLCTLSFNLRVRGKVVAGVNRMRPSLKSSETEEISGKISKIQVTSISKQLLGF